MTTGEAVPDVPIGKPTTVPVDALRFDTDNPRYSEDREVNVDRKAEVITYLIERADLQELVDSIAYSGYIDIEPLIVHKKDDGLTVLEGNRRLAAITLLTDDKLANACGVQVPRITDQVAATLEAVTVYAVKDRPDARDFIGFKHINGPHRWDSVAKGRFAARWYEDELAKGKNGMSLRDIARRMGDRHDTIQRMVAGIFVLDQARESSLFQVEDRYPGRPFAFSHLYTALTRGPYREYLGLPSDWRAHDPQPNPVPEDRHDQLKQVMLWLYGSDQDEVRPVVTSQNPHIKQLGEVLSKPKAIAILVGGHDLKAAYAEVSTPANQFEEQLVKAHQLAEGALSKLPAYDGSDGALLDVAAELNSTVTLIHDNMKTARHKFLHERIEHDH